MTLIQELAYIFLPIFIISGLGILWSHLNFSLDGQSIRKLLMNIATPCLILDGISKLEVPFSEVAIVMTASVILLLGCSIIGFVLLFLCKLPKTSFLPAITFGNAGNIGLPLCFFVYGSEGLGFASAVFLVAVVSQFTLVPILQGRSPPFKTILYTPVIYSSVLGIFLLITESRLPVPIDVSISLLANLAIPLSLFSLGFGLAKFRIASLNIALGLGVSRLIIGFSVAFIVNKIVGLNGIAAGVLLIQGAMPSAIFTYLFSSEYKRNPEDIAGIVLASTLISIFTLPVIVYYLI